MSKLPPISANSVHEDIELFLHVAANVESHTLDVTDVGEAGKEFILLSVHSSVRSVSLTSRGRDPKINCATVNNSSSPWNCKSSKSMSTLWIMLAMSGDSIMTRQRHGVRSPCGPCWIPGRAKLDPSCGRIWQCCLRSLSGMPPALYRWSWRSYRRVTCKRVRTGAK